MVLKLIKLPYKRLFFSGIQCGNACFKYRDGDHYYNGDFTAEFVGIFGVAGILMITSLVVMVCLVPNKRCQLVRNNVEPVLVRWNKTASDLNASFKGPVSNHTVKYVPCCFGGCGECRVEGTKCHQSCILVTNKTAGGAVHQNNDGYTVWM